MLTKVSAEVSGLLSGKCTGQIVEWNSTELGLKAGGLHRLGVLQTVERTLGCYSQLGEGGAPASRGRGLTGEGKSRGGFRERRVGQRAGLT